MRFECPETGEPLSALSAGQWPGRGDELVSMHCPRCSKLHSFARTEGVLAPAPLQAVPEVAAPA
jgi:hypothetical protein